MKVVIDASVAVKWFICEAGKQRQTDKAIQLFTDIQSHSVKPLQPVHWQAEMISELAISLDHHLFDTFYHAVALLGDAVLMTDNRNYFDKARSYGKIQLIEDYQTPLLG